MLALDRMIPACFQRGDAAVEFSEVKSGADSRKHGCQLGSLGRGQRPISYRLNNGPERLAQIGRGAQFG